LEGREKKKERTLTSARFSMRISGEAARRQSPVMFWRFLDVGKVTMRCGRTR
jgi:hypothetical protein